MGTQQILMIVLAIIVVGAAIAVGIAMFDTQARNQTRRAITAEIADIAVQAQAWFRTPKMLAGGEGSFDSNDIDSLIAYINGGRIGDIVTPTGTYTITYESDNNIRISAISLKYEITIEVIVNLDGGGDNNGIRFL